MLGLRNVGSKKEKTIMKTILSALLALSVLAGVAGSAYADDPSCDGYLRDGLRCWGDQP
jgi:hypothetical protein